MQILFFTQGRNEMIDFFQEYGKTPLKKKEDPRESSFSYSAGAGYFLAILVVFIWRLFVSLRKQIFHNFS